MTASDAESWARLRLVQGESSAQKWELVSSQGHTTLTVGSGADCTWVVRAEGVRPIHFSLHWDGTTLRVADVYAAGDVRVDGTVLTSQWRPLFGRVRIDFGQAAMVVETSATQSRSDHPLDPPPAEAPRSGSSNPPRNAKETLIGVAPLAKGAPAPALQGFVPARPEPTSEPPSPASGPVHVLSPANKKSNSMKATLVGGIQVGNLPGALPSSPPPSSHPPPGSMAPGPIQVVGSGPPAPASSGPRPNATLMGFSVVDALRGGVGTQPTMQVGAQPGADARTAQGFPTTSSPSTPAPGNSNYPPSRRMTQKGVVSEPPGVHFEHGPTAAPRSPLPPAPAAGRIGSAWQERPGEDAYQGPPPPPDPVVDRGASRRPPRMPGGRDIGERLSDIPTQMRDPATFTSRRPKQGIPWRYVGVLVLTGVAYFAWLYLLDHL